MAAQATVQVPAPMFADQKDWRKIEFKFPAHCAECGGYLEPRKQGMYNAKTKKSRCFKCHVGMPTPMEVWLADVEVEDEDTEERVTVRRNILIETKRRELSMPDGVKLIQIVDVIAPEAWKTMTIKEARAKYSSTGHYTA